MKKHISTILLLTALLTGLSLLVYPSFSDWWNSFHQTRAIDSYAQAVAALDAESYDALWQEARAYNDSLLQRPNSFVLSEDQRKTYGNLLNAGGNGIMGYISIPAIQVSLPIYHGTEEGVLQVAAGHLEWTSLPVGGQSSHCVISGHRGLPSARLFTDLDALAEGDIFELHTLGQVLTYQVDQIRTVKPHETEELLIEEGKDLCTLVTCTPYGINSHRLLVRGRRVEAEEEKTVYLTADGIRMEPMLVASAVAVPVFLALLVLWMLPGRHNGGEMDEAL